MVDYKAEIKQAVGQISDEAIACARQIHRLAEPSGKEYQSAEALCELLENNGFKVERKLLPQLPTAFRASYGNGGVRICYLCEYDALPALQQDDVPYPSGDGGYGHGCGHNLLGAGSAAAGIAIKKLIEKNKLDATVVVYGTPAEETLEGKTIMVREGCFRDADVCLGWHPLDHNDCGEVKFKACASFTMTFHGKKAHACNCPQNGRSALDAAELTNIGCNYLREHIDRESYLHYSYIHGGECPNIVPDYAKLWYMARAYTYEQMTELVERIKRVAQGACMMTDTTVEFEQLGDNHDNLINFTLAQLAYDCMKQIGTPHFTDEERDYARRVAQALNLAGVNGELEETLTVPDGTIKKDNGSSDISDVSRVVPTVNINTTCYGRHTPNHSWAVTVQTDRSAAHKGMLFAAEVLALMGATLATQPSLLAKVRQEFSSAQ